MVVDMVPFDTFPHKDLHRALEIPYRQLPDVTIVALLDDTGSAVAPPFHKSKNAAAVLGREGVEKRDLEIFSHNVPLKLALTAEVAIGPVYLSHAGSPRMVMAKAYRLGDGETSWVLAAEVSLSSICGLVNDYGRSHVRNARAIDVQERIVCDSGSENIPSLKIYQPAEEIEEVAQGKASFYDDENGEPVLGATADVEAIGWHLLIEEPERIALAPVQRSLSWIAIWVIVCLAIAIGGGVILSKELTQPITMLEAAASRIAKGDYNRTLTLKSRDELGRLASAFNHMTAEIQAWNAELTERVEERTRDLREAREQIVRTQKLAAVGELGSGVAHEINNPLTTVIGVAQLLGTEVDPKSDVAKGLADIITSARRVANIVDTLLRFSQTQVLPEMQSVDAGRVINGTLDMFASRLKERRINVKVSIEDECRFFAQESDMRLALNHLLDNATRVLADGGHIDIVARHIEGSAVRITITDDGPGMTEEVRTRVFDPFFTTKNAGSSSAQGLGMAIVHQVINEHNGRIVIDSEIGKGTTVNIYLPGAAKLSRD